MIQSADIKASAAQEASKLMSESLAGSIIIGDMYIDKNLNLFNEPYNKYKVIHLMENDLYDGKYEKLNEWLCKQWGDISLPNFFMQKFIL